MPSQSYDWVAYHSGKRPEALALSCVERDAHVTWGELEARVSRLAYVLREEYGLQPGERVMLIAENDTRIFELQFACMRVGLILVPLNWRLAIGELVTLAKDADPGIMIHDGLWREVAQKVAEACGIEHLLEWDENGDTSPYDSRIEAAGGQLAGEIHDDDTVTHILYTSGTTGLPKGAMCTHGTLKHQALNLAHTSRMAERGGHHLNMVPLFHAGGLNVYSNPTLYWGGHVTTIRRFDPANVLAMLTDPEIGITHLCGVLQMYEMITALPQFAEASFPALRAALFGGWGPKTVWVHDAWRQRGFFLQLSYGATEIGPNVTILEGGEGKADMNCSGPTVPHTEMRLVDEKGQDVAQGEVGEIWVRGPAITPGYWNRPKEDYFSGDWFRTGDCGRLDELGQLYVVDRLREVYRSGGENVYPAEVELALADMPGIREVAVIGVPDARWGEVGLAIVELEDGGKVELDGMLEFVSDRLARFKQPRHLVTVDEIPRNVTLKIDRKGLKETYRPQFDTPVPASAEDA